MAPLKDVVRDRLLAMVKGVQPKEFWKVLVVDQRSMRILSTSCRMHDVMEAGVTIVENVALKRKRLQFEAIYFLSPIESSVDKLIEDFDNSWEPKYASIHLFFTAQLPDNLFAKLKNAKGVLKNLKNMTELNIDYLAPEEQVFTLDSPMMFYDIYSPNSKQVNEFLSHIANQVATVCTTLGEYPVVRYSTNTPHTATLATKLQIRLDDLQKLADPSQLAGKPKGQILILDRSLDPTSALLHELTYQAMIYDVLPITNDVYTHTYRNGRGETVTQELVLGDHDQVYMSTRHLHISQASKFIAEKMAEFKAKAKANKLKASEKVTTAELSEALKAMPQYQEDLKRIGLHVSLAEQCMQLLFKGSDTRQGPLEKIILMQQDMVDGTYQKDKTRNLMNDLVPILQDPNVSHENKLRMLMLYVIVKNGACDNLAKLMSLAEIPEPERPTIENLQQLGVPFTVKDAEKLKKKKNRKNRDDEGEKLVLSRWVPVLKDVLEDCTDDKLDKDEFAYVRESDASKSAADSGPAVASARTRPGWANKNKDKTGAKETGKATESRNGPPLFVFVLGGLTYSEMRVAYEVGKAKNRDIYIGGTCLLTPQMFLEQLNALNQKERPSGTLGGISTNDVAINIAQTM
eukprot:Colp12_sorted_trinity150504_noHs@1022